ncbi:MAG: hypothetical protein QGI29_04615, partial [Pirellulales bacterium]|nr:hypothetical protein [Pirellulales bacterium]
MVSCDAATVRHIVTSNGNIPWELFSASLTEQLFFTSKFFEYLARSVHPELKFAGSMVLQDYDDVPHLVYRQPPGRKQLDGIAVWMWQEGHCFLTSARQLATWSPTQFAKQIEWSILPDFGVNLEAIEAKKLKFLCLGVTPDEGFHDFVHSSGTVRERKWKRFKWEPPLNNGSECWWVVNHFVQDQSQAISLKQCSVIQMEAARQLRTIVAEYKQLGGDDALQAYVGIVDPSWPVAEKRNDLRAILEYETAGGDADLTKHVGDVNAIWTVAQKKDMLNQIRHNNEVERRKCREERAKMERADVESTLREVGSRYLCRLHKMFANTMEKLACPHRKFYNDDQDSDPLQDEFNRKVQSEFEGHFVKLGAQPDSQRIVVDLLRKALTATIPERRSAVAELKELKYVELADVLDHKYTGR